MSDTPNTTPAFERRISLDRPPVNAIVVSSRSQQREVVYSFIDSERNYQDRKWNPATCMSGGVHTRTEWLVYIDDYIKEAMHIVSREAYQRCNHRIDAIMRKVAAMTVACMEQNGGHPRYEDTFQA